jgi:hypothetical protein
MRASEALSALSDKARRGCPTNFCHGSAFNGGFVHVISGIRKESGILDQA